MNALASSTQQNQDQNANSGGAIGELESNASFGLTDFFNNLGASSANPVASASGSGVFNVGEKKVFSGTTTNITNEKIGTVKMLLLVGVCVAGFIAYKKWGK